jgi:hypothetical protein
VPLLCTAVPLVSFDVWRTVLLKCSCGRWRVGHLDSGIEEEPEAVQGNENGVLCMRLRQTRSTRRLRGGRAGLAKRVCYTELPSVVK